MGYEFGSRRKMQRSGENHICSFFRAWLETARNGWPPANPARVVSPGRPPGGLSVTLWGAQDAHGSRFELRETRARRPTRRFGVYYHVDG